MRKPKSTAAQNAARTRRLKKQLAEIVCQSRGDAFNAFIAIAAREKPNGSLMRSIRWFEDAWRDALRPGAK